MKCMYNAVDNDDDDDDDDAEGLELWMSLCF